MSPKPVLPQGDVLHDFFKNYSLTLSSALESVSKDQLDAVFSLLKSALKRKSHIYTGGNGGSAAIANHLCCDWMQGTRVSGQPALKVHSLSSNIPLLTALANDRGYENSLSEQVETLMEPGDVLVLISSSGESANIVRAAELAKKKGLTVIGLTGFSGGKLRELSNACLHVHAQNYGVIEDAHQAVMHVLAQFLQKERSSTS